MPHTHRITLAPDDTGQRIDKVLSRSLPSVSRSRLQALISAGLVTGYTPSSTSEPQPITSPSYKLKAESVLIVDVPEAENAVPEPEDIPLDVVFEDEHLILVNKPPGMVVHPAPGSPTGTLVNALLQHCAGSLSGIGGVKRPGIVHRIDKDTSGLLVMAKHDAAHQGLARQFEAHTIERRYIALVRGHPRPLDGRIEGNIARHPVDRKRMSVSSDGGKKAVTHYRTTALYAARGTALAARIECRLETGRTHQVRVHMTHIGHALIGDPVYGRGPKLPVRLPAEARSALLSFKRQALHAHSLGFHHPVTGEDLYFSADPPHDMHRLMDALAPYKLDFAS